jgi:hypothetical protein
MASELAVRGGASVQLFDDRIEGNDLVFTSSQGVLTVTSKKRDDESTVTVKNSSGSVVFRVIPKQQVAPGIVVNGRLVPSDGEPIVYNDNSAYATGSSIAIGGSGNTIFDQYTTKRGLEVISASAPNKKANQVSSYAIKLSDLRTIRVDKTSAVTINSGKLNKYVTVHVLNSGMVNVMRACESTAVKVCARERAKINWHSSVDTATGLVEETASVSFDLIKTKMAIVASNAAVVTATVASGCQLDNCNTEQSTIVIETD